MDPFKARRDFIYSYFFTEEFVASVRMLEGGVSSQQKPSHPDVSSGSSAASLPAPVPAPPPSVAPNPAPAPVPAPAPPSHAPFPPTKLVIKQGGGGASVSWSTSCPPAAASKPAAEPAAQNSAFGRSPAASPSPDDDDDALPQRVSKPPIKTYEARRRTSLKLKIKQDQTGFSKVVHNTALDPEHTPQPQSTPDPAKPRPPSTPPRAQSPAFTAAPAFPAATTTTRCNPPVRDSAPPGAASSSTQMNGTLEHHSTGGAKHNPASTAAPMQTTCRLPLRKTYRENVSPRVRPGVPGGGGDILSHPRTTPSPPRHEASTPPSERTVIASVKVDRRERGGLPPHTEPIHDGGGSGPDRTNEVFNCGVKPPHHLPLLLNREGAKERGAGPVDQEMDVGKYKRLNEKNRHRTGGAFRMDQHAPGPPSPESSFTRDSLLPAKRCKSDSPDMDNASFSSGSPPDDSLNEHLQCAIDSILNLQQEPPTCGLHIRGGSGRPHHQSQRPGGSAASSHRSAVPAPPSAPPPASLAQHPQVGGRGHNGSLVPQTQSR